MTELENAATRPGVTDAELETIRAESLAAITRPTMAADQRGEVQ